MKNFGGASTLVKPPKRFKPKRGILQTGPRVKVFPLFLETQQAR